jgi:hypothetical protein
MKQKKEYDILKSQMPEDRASYLKCSSNDRTKVKVMLTNEKFSGKYNIALSYIGLNALFIDTSP